MFERLTERDEYGNTDIVGVESADLQLNLEFDEFNKVTKWWEPQEFVHLVGPAHEKRN